LTAPDGGPVVSGKLSVGHNVTVGFLSQHAESLGAEGARTVLEACVKRTGLPPGQARALLGQFLFSGEDAEKSLDGLSGGERQRLQLAILVQSGANVLILDEPTNHLDVDSREALEEALSGFQGSLMLISHDRALLDAVGTRTIALEDQRLHSYTGGWPEYVRIRAEREAAAAEAKAAAKAPAAQRARAQAPTSKSADAGRNGSGASAKPGGASAKPGGASTNGSSRNGSKPKPGKSTAKLEAQIEAAEAELAAVEAELVQGWSAEAADRYETAKAAVDTLYAQYEQVAG
jgi:ATP-binding cassette subfamily F protein 3